MNRKSIVGITFLMHFVVAIAMAQHQITVSVTDVANDAPMPGASIQLEGTIYQGKADAAGTAIIRQIKPGAYSIVVSYLGYQSEKQQVTINNDQHVEVALRQATLLTDEVVVQATRATENTATTYKNIGKEDIAKSNLGQDIPYLLDQTPGVRISSDAGPGIGYTAMRIRGSDGQRTNVTINGIPLNDAESMGAFFVNLPDFASSVDNVQIQRGVGTSTNGAGAFGASLNFQTNTLNEQPYAELDNSFGSYNTLKNTVRLGS